MTATLFIDVDSAHTQHLVAEMIRRTSAPGIRFWLERGMYPFLRGRLAQRFANEGDDASGKWVDLKDTTAAIRVSQGFGGFHPINIRTGGMVAALLSGYRILYGGYMLKIPGSLDKAVTKKVLTAQAGAPGDASHAATPPRPVLAMSTVDSAQGLRSLEAWIRTGGF